METPRSSTATPEPRPDRAPGSDVDAQRAMNASAIRLLRDWMADESGYDEATWPLVKRTIEANRLSARPRFHG